MTKKLEYMVIASTLCLVNVILLDTAYNVIGIGFGLWSVVYWIKAIRIRK